MKFFSIFSAPTLSPTWQYRPGGLIWRILFSEHSRIVGEVRDDEKKIASFFCIDEHSGSPLWEGVQLETPWWVGIESVQGEYVVLHGFAKPDMPEHRGIYVLDLHSGKERWKNAELTYWFAYRDKLYAYRDRFEKRIGYALSLDSGEVVEMFENEVEALQPLRKLAQEETEHSGFAFPELAAADMLPPRVKQLLQKEAKGRDVVGEIEFMEEGDFLIFNYYTSGGNALQNRIAVFERQKHHRVYSETLTTNAKAPIPDSFFVKDGSLFFIKDQQTLVAVTLWKS
ncbi:MAG TPA: DUF4905 domain-containing protein [Bacteroidota bacterium]|nr:DUF4905 domain-containing protein [Bacteroidota bacterium]